jgi:hypothetical protein
MMRVMENVANDTNELNVVSSDIALASDSFCKVQVTHNSLRDTVTVNALLCGGN